MEIRNLGGSGLRVSAVGLGCNNFGQRLDVEGTRKVIHKAFDVGITLFDTADVYGEGRMEKLLGARLPTNRTAVVTKIGTNLAAGQKQFESSWLYMAFDRSEERLARKGRVRPVEVRDPDLAVHGEQDRQEADRRQEPGSSHRGEGDGGAGEAVSDRSRHEVKRREAAGMEHVVDRPE